MATGLSSSAEALNRLASRCDTMCLTAGVQLGEAAPKLFDLSSSLASLSEMLVNKEGAQATSSLEAVAREIMAIGSTLARERDAIGNLINLNDVLTRRIEELSDHVRFLSSVVSNVKIEIAAIEEGEVRLEGFADNLKRLAEKSNLTVKAFQSTHRMLVKQLQRAGKAQSTFIGSHGIKFLEASNEISASLSAVSERRKVIAGIAAEISKLTQQIATEVSQCVVALQVGDSTRQRLEHASASLSTGADVIAGKDIEGSIEEDDGAERREWIAARLCALTSILTTEATNEFAKEIGTIAYLIKNIGDATVALTDKSRGLVASPSDGSHSFLRDLEIKLAAAAELIEECAQSRQLLDDTAEQVVASIQSLQRLAADVAGMATDMTIIGTNAVVTSYRLGQRGIPLSVIAQHLRSHAIQVTDAVTVVSPALDAVLDAAKQFTSAREGQDARSMGALATRLTEALSAFQSSDRVVDETRERLDAEVAAVGGVLRQARDALGEIDDVETELLGLADTTSELGEASADGTYPDDTFPQPLAGLLRKRYTMGSERSLHDSFFVDVMEPQGAAPVAVETDASLWL
jgi:hypothetical protein